MKKLNQYIGINIISSIALVILILISLEIFIEFSKEFSDIGTGNYNISQAFLYVFMILPSGIYQFFPMAGLLGCLIGLGMLASRSELIVMRAAGFSTFKIATVVLQASLIIIFIAIIAGEIVAPPLQHYATEYKTQALTKGQALQTAHGVWLRKDKEFIHINKVHNRHRLDNITKYQFDDNNNLISASSAKRGKYSNGNWVFTNIEESQFSKNRIDSSTYPEQVWKLKIKPHLLGLINVDADERSLPQLFSYIKYLHYSGLRANRYEFLFWQRILQPFTILAMILLAIPFIFGPLRTVSMGLRIFTGTIAGLMFFILNGFLGPIASVLQIPAFLIALMPILLVSALGIYLLSRTG